MIRLAETAPAKLNLFLHVLGKRDDEYHDIYSLMGFTEFGDIVEASTAESEISLEISGPFAGLLYGSEDNLVLQAAHALRRACEVSSGAHIHLQKHIPVASGLGGGSSDAAATLRLLYRLWDAPCSQDQLFEIAAELGSDVPACLSSKPLIAEGRGEIIRPVAPMPDYSIVMANPGVMVLSGDVFSACNVYHDQVATLPDPLNKDAWLETLATHTHNSLEPSAFALSAEIEDAKALLAEQKGCGLARMSGSGATCFGLFDSKRDATRAAKQIALTCPNWWVVVTQFRAVGK